MCHLAGELIRECALWVLISQLLGFVKGLDEGRINRLLKECLKFKINISEPGRYGSTALA